MTSHGTHLFSPGLSAKYNEGCKLHVSSVHDERAFSCLKALSHEAIFSCNLQRNGVSSCLLQEKSPPVAPPAGHTTTCICLQFYRSLQYLFHPNLRSKLQEKFASCYSAFKRVKTYLRRQCQNTVVPISQASL